MLYWNCALTVVLELIFFLLTGYGRREHFVPLCIAVNIATNLTINLILSAYSAAWLLLMLEALVVVTEYGVYAAAYGRSRKLAALTLGANLLTFLTGVCLYGV